MIIDKRNKKNDIIISKDIYAISNYNNVSVPLRIQYEKLEKQLQDRINKKYNIIDNRGGSKIPIGDAVKPLITPGVSNKITNQSAITFDEPNTKPAYPSSTIPYSQGLVWE